MAADCAAAERAAAERVADSIRKAMQGILHSFIQLIEQVYAGCLG